MHSDHHAPDLSHCVPPERTTSAETDTERTPTSRRPKIQREHRRGSPTPATILVISNEPEHRQIVARILGQEGYDVVQATGGDDARQAIDSPVQPGLVVIGPDLLTRTGLELLTWIRAEHPTLRLLATVGSLNKLNWITRHVEDVAVLINPFTSAQITRAIKRLLEHDGGAASSHLPRESGKHDPLQREEEFEHLAHAPAPSGNRRPITHLKSA